MGVVIQQPMCVSNKTYIGILTGAYKITGGVVRHAHGKQKGRIVEHLKPANVNEEGQIKKAVQQGAKAGGKALVEIKKVDKRLIAVAGVTAVVVAAGATVYYIANGRETKDLRVFRKALANYVKAAEKGRIRLKDIVEFEKSIEKLAVHEDFDEICRLLDEQGLPQLASLLMQHTAKMVTDNSNIIDFETAQRLRSTGVPLQDLKNCLDVQRALFEKAAA